MYIVHLKCTPAPPFTFLNAPPVYKFAEILKKSSHPKINYTLLAYLP